MVTDQSQAVVWQTEQTPFGEVTQTTGTLAQPLRFPGQYADPETGYSYNYFRDYDPSVGRYVQSDPIGLDGGINTYGYVLQNPLSFTDIFGLANSGKPVDLGGGNKVRIDNPHVPGQQEHAHFEGPKGEGVVNKDGTQSHTGKGSLNNMTKKIKKYLEKKGFKLPCAACSLIPEELEQLYCVMHPYDCIEYVPDC
ncbi:MAG: RHS repeat-associated core domain-containing protein [Hahellaceae bacterium]|nr:RHS repeat-associated core domain-containing protein [Hahellaceae bacterium]